MAFLQGSLEVESAAARAVREDLERRGYHVELWSVAPGAGLVGFLPEDGALLYVDSGVAELDVDGRILHLAAGEQAIVPRGSVHALRNPGDAPLTWLAAVRARSVEATF